MALEVLGLIRNLRPLTVIDTYVHRLHTFEKSISKELRSQDESTFLSFLQSKIHPIFLHYQYLDERTERAVSTYFSSLDLEYQAIYKKRRSFEHTVALINQTVGDYLEKEQAQLQGLTPHYFEKYKTDGVEYNMYMGKSLSRHGDYHEVYLKNLRLWQLEAMCALDTQLKDLRPRMEVALDFTHLILVQSTPLAIRFRLDEKRFDVDGTYNLQYEIMKKRIDKATVLGTEERLTQPHKIAIVYRLASEAVEYREYLDYLIEKGRIDPIIESLSLNDLQGLSGLRALRVKIN